jgi:hypothetical protein
MGENVLTSALTLSGRFCIVCGILLWLSIEENIHVARFD